MQLGHKNKYIDYKHNLISHLERKGHFVYRVLNA